MLAIVLPNLLLYGGVFYSGHLFLISTFVIVGSWATLCVVGFPFLKLEAIASSSYIDRRKSIVALIAVLTAAIVIDGFIRARFD